MSLPSTHSSAVPTIICILHTYQLGIHQADTSSFVCGGGALGKVVFRESISATVLNEDDQTPPIDLIFSPAV